MPVEARNGLKGMPVEPRNGKKCQLRHEMVGCARPFRASTGIYLHLPNGKERNDPKREPGAPQIKKLPTGSSNESKVAEE